MRILVVEDSVKMAAVLKRGLEEEGYAVDVAGTGQDGLWMAEQTPNDAVVLDVMLPDMDGFEVFPGACGSAVSGRRSSCSRPAAGSRTGWPGWMPGE